jgi:hypothetical protein
MRENYRQTPLWSAAYQVGKEVHLLTEDIAQNPIIRILRDQAEALPVSIILANDEPADPTDSLRITYEHAHDVEYHLFLSLLFRYLRDEQTRPIVWRIARVKRLIVAALSAFDARA